MHLQKFKNSARPRPVYILRFCQLYAVTPTLYESANRARGVGTAITLGRAGSIVSPMIIGVLLDAGWPPVNLFYLNAAVFALAIFAVLKLKQLKPL